MRYAIELGPLALLHIDRHKRAGSKQLLAKIEGLFAELAEHPRIGTGKPEQLKNYTTETWLRRIDRQHRLVYEIHDEEVVVIVVAAYGHYDEK